MKADIVIAGVGGQGILSIAAAIATAALKQNLYMKQSEVHGMSQRGGAVQSHLRISDKPIASDLIRAGSADLILSIEPMESLRYLPFLSDTGWLVTNSNPYINTSNYPETGTLLGEIKTLPRHILLDADGIAKQLKSPRSMNMVVLGAATPFIDIPYESFRDGIAEIFASKGEEVIQQNLQALEAGRNIALKK